MSGPRPERRIPSAERTTTYPAPLVVLGTPPRAIAEPLAEVNGEATITAEEVDKAPSGQQGHLLRRRGAGRLASRRQRHAGVLRQRAQDLGRAARSRIRADHRRRARAGEIAAEEFGLRGPYSRYNAIFIARA